LAATDRRRETAVGGQPLRADDRTADRSFSDVGQAMAPERGERLPGLRCLQEIELWAQRESSRQLVSGSGGFADASRDHPGVVPEVRVRCAERQRPSWARSPRRPSDGHRARDPSDTGGSRRAEGNDGRERDPPRDLLTRRSRIASPRRGVHVRRLPRADILRWDLLRPWRGQPPPARPHLP
jgi:hypothetical protein